MLDPVDLLLEWLGHCVGDDLRARARIEGADDDLGLIDPASIMMTAMADAKIGRWKKNHHVTAPHNIGGETARRVRLGLRNRRAEPQHRARSPQAPVD